MNSKIRRHTINGNGFRLNVDLYAEDMAKLPIKKAQLLKANKQLWQGLTKIQQALSTMPDELYALLGDTIAEAGERISDEAGKIGATYDYISDNRGGN
jgi:hypothetical protein